MPTVEATWRTLDPLRRRAIRPTHRVESTRASSRELQTARQRPLLPPVAVDEPG